MWSSAVQLFRNGHLCLSAWMVRSTVCGYPLSDTVYPLRWVRGGAIQRETRFSATRKGNRVRGCQKDSLRLDANTSKKVDNQCSMVEHACVRVPSR